MKVIVKDYLNVRVGKPSINAPTYQYLAPGSEIEVEDALYEGDKFDGSTKWLKDKAGNYYWVGGVVNETINVQVTLSSRFDDVIKTYPGDGINIGVAFLDSGVNDKHLFLSKRIKFYESFLEGNSKDNISSHGNLIAGILSSEDPSVSRNKSDLYCFRVAFNSKTQVDRIDNTAVKLALEQIRDNSKLINKINVVNLSLDIIEQYVQILQPIINSIIVNGTLIVVSAGENSIPNNTYSLQNVLKVATFDPINFSSYKVNGFPLQDCLYFLNHPIPSYSLAGSSIDDEISHDSAYCAFTSAIVSKALSIGIKSSDINNYIKNISKSIRSEIEPKPFTPYLS